MQQAIKKQISDLIPHGDPWNLAGPRYKKTRQEVMRLITGVKIPVAKCGVTAIRKALFDASGVTGSCLAVRADNLAKWLTGAEANQ